MRGTAMGTKYRRQDMDVFANVLQYETIGDGSLHLSTACPAVALVLYSRVGKEFLYALSPCSFVPL